LHFSTYLVRYRFLFRLSKFLYPLGTPSKRRRGSMLYFLKSQHVALWTAFLSSLWSGVLATDVLETSGFSSCGSDSDFQVQKMNITYDKTTQLVTFDVAGTSTKVQNVTASLVVTAYGQKVYSNSFDPCDASTKVEQLCPSMLELTVGRNRQTN
jgi:hypothetical protein